MHELGLSLPRRISTPHIGIGRRKECDVLFDPNCKTITFSRPGAKPIFFRRLSRINFRKIANYKSPVSVRTQPVTAMQTKQTKTIIKPPPKPMQRQTIVKPPKVSVKSEPIRTKNTDNKFLTFLPYFIIATALLILIRR